MGLISLLCKNIKIILIISVVVISIIFQDQLQSLYSSFIKNQKVGVKTKNKSIFTEQELSQYDGNVNKKLYLALMGSVFDVSKGKTHYGEGGSYHYFVGKDGSRSFITGNFRNENEDRDHVIDLTCDELFGLVQWKATFKQKYKLVGVLVGRYYEESGEPTAYSRQLEERIDQCKYEKEREKQAEEKFPPCNMEWSVSDGSKVWCTKNSGGISRSWVGVPRQLYTPGEDKPRCVCINLQMDNSALLLKEYDNCQPESTTCVVADD
ncbi:hypothetical protein O0L34_g7279 [Tuta absoluta]|nr:hypothetical protein O0L34_g7279 [Tuta absoluta]